MYISFRRIIWVGAGVLGLVMVMVVGLKLYFNSDRLRLMLVPQLSTGLKRSVQLQGVGLGFWGGVHASVAGLEVAERTGFGTQPFLRVGEARAFVDFWPLLWGDVVISQIYLHGPQVSVVVLKSGEANYTDLTQQSDDTAGDESGVSLHDIVIEDGIVWYVDETTQTQMELQDIDYVFEMAPVAEDWNVNGTLSIARVGWQQGGQRDTLDTGILSLTHQLRLEKDAWVVTALDMDWAGLAVAMSGRIETLGDALNLNLKIEEPGLDLGTTQLHEVAQLPIDVVGKASVKLQVVGALDLDATPQKYPELMGQVVLSGVEISGKDLIGKTHIDKAVLSLVDGVLVLESLNGLALGGQFSVSGRVAPVWPPNDNKRILVRLDAQTDVLKLPESSTSEESGASGLGDMLAWLRMLDARLSAQIGHLSMPGLDVQNVRTNITLTDGLLNVGSLRGDMYEGHVDLSGVLDARIRHQSFPIEMRVNTDRLRLKPLLGVAGDVDGILTAELHGRALLDAQLHPVLDTGKYTLLGKMLLQDGVLKTPQLLEPVDSLGVSVGFLPGNVVEIKRMVARAGESDFSMLGRVEGLLDYVLQSELKTRPLAAVTVGARVLNMDALFPVEVLAEGDQTSGVLVGMRTVDGRLDLAIGSLISDSTRYIDFKAVAVTKDGVLKIDNIRANTMGGAMVAQVEIDGRKKELIPMTATAALSRIQAERFLQGYMRWPIPVFGQLGVSVKLDGQMDSTLTLVEKNIRAEGEARVDDGRVVNWPWLQTSSGFVPHLQFLNFSDLPLKSLIAPFKMDNGRVFLNQMGFRSGDVGFQLVGSVGIDGTLDMAVDADVPASRLNISKLGLDRVGLNLKPDTRIPLRIHIGGTSDKPKMDVKVQAEAKKVLEEKSQEVKDKIKDKTKGLLKSLF